MGPISVLPIPKNSQLRSLAAAWSIKTWRDSFPNDTAQWYLNLYKTGDYRKQMPHTIAAVMGTKLVGIGSLIADDELPLATEPGPWLAAVYVHPKFRGLGAGTQIVNALLDHAFSIGYSDVYGYTETKRGWYESMGWEYLRDATLKDHNVSVIRKRLT
jgi:GNAT superfamily N-acetyltransferase